MSLYGLGLRNGLIDDRSGGAAILNHGRLFIDKLAVYSNVTVGTSDLSGGWPGGAIASAGGQVAITASNICCNVARDSGPAALVIERGELTTMPVIKLLGGENVRRGFIDAVAFRTILENIPTTDVRDVIEFLYNSGWRSREAMALNGPGSI